MEFKPELIIPIIAVGGSLAIPVFWFYFDARKKASRDRMLEKALEHGASIEDVQVLLAESEGEEERSGKSEKAGRQRFRSGLVLMAIGGGLLMACELELLRSPDAGPAGVFGLIGLFLGIALFVADLLNGKPKG